MGLARRTSAGLGRTPRPRAHRRPLGWTRVRASPHVWRGGQSGTAPHRGRGAGGRLGPAPVRSTDPGAPRGGARPAAPGVRPVRGRGRAAVRMATRAPPAPKSAPSPMPNGCAWARRRWSRSAARGWAAALSGRARGSPRRAAVGGLGIVGGCGLMSRWWWGARPCRTDGCSAARGGEAGLCRRSLTRTPALGAPLRSPAGPRWALRATTWPTLPLLP